MNIKYKILVAAILWLSFAIDTNAQFKHEMSVSAAGSVSALSYKTTLGKQQFGMGASGGIEYMFFFSPKMGVGTGVEIASYNSVYNANKLEYSQLGLKDTENDAFDFYSSIENYREKQNATYLNIPFKVQYQTGKKHQLFAAVGAKIGIPMSGKAKLAKATFINKGYYPLIDNWLETQEFMGFGTFTNKKFSEKLNFKTALMLTAEVGVKWRVKDKMALYTGAYIDYGLNEVFDNKNPKHFYSYDPLNGRNFATNTIMTSNYVNEKGKNTAFNEKVKPIAIGLKVRFTIGIGKAKTRTVAEEEMLPIVVLDNNAEEKITKEEDTKVSEDKDKNDTDKTVDNEKIDKMGKSEKEQNSDLGNDDDSNKKGKSKEQKKETAEDEKSKSDILKNLDDKIAKIAEGATAKDDNRYADKAKESDQSNGTKASKDKTNKTPKKGDADIKLTDDGSKTVGGVNRLDESKPREYTRENREILECITDGYEVNKADLSPENKAKLDRVVTYLKNHPTVNIYCEGNTCDLGGVTLNYNLGMVRALFVKDYLTSNGISGARINPESKGKYNMKYKNTSEANRKLNRRVEVTIAN